MSTELAKAYVQIIPSAQGIKGSITKVLGGEADQAGKNAGQSIASRLVGKLKTVIATAGIGKAIQSSLMEGAALQQSIGGIETMFQNSANRVITNAKNAYLTAGMSANEYMENVTSFSASLLQGLAGDTNKAADIADMALKDMSDNANKMGTSMELIQNAYQGFSKQNYTMLDNLKLGYGGTQKEMLRLLEDAKKLTGIEYNIDNLSDVYSAIHAIQNEMGITGTTALEASKTFSGSFDSMKAAAKNLLGNLALGEDIFLSLKALMGTTGTFVFNNFLPMIENIFGSIGKIIQQKGPEMISAGTIMLQSFAKGIGEKLPDLIPQALKVVVSLADAIISNLPVIVSSGINLLVGLVQGVINSLPTLIAEGPRIINEFASAIYSGIWQLISTGAEMLVSLAQGIWNNRELLLENAGEILMAFLNIFSLSKLVSLGQSLVSSLASGIKSLGPNIVSAGKGLLQNLVSGIKALATHPVTTLKSIATNAINAMKALDWKGIGKNIISGIVSGVKATASKLVEAAAKAVTDALNWVKNKLGIHSPSVVFRDQVGKMIDLGLAEGITKNAKTVSDSMKALSMATIGGIDTNFDVSNNVNSYNAFDIYALGDYIVQAVMEQGRMQATALEKGIKNIKMVPDKRETARYLAEMGFVRG